MLKKFIEVVFTMIIGALVATIVFVCMFTPEKTKDGTFTDPYKYWTDNAYVCKNFDAMCDINKK